MGEAPDLRRSVVVILVEPQHPGNVGAVARAMKNMGLWRLVLVDPPAYDPERARWMAPGCEDLLAEVRIVPTLDEALHGVHRAFATTARHRRDQQPVLEPAELADLVMDGPAEQVVAVLFGREDHGLSREQVQRCEGVIRIPTPEHASLNLAQAALVVARDLFEAARRRGLKATGRTVSGIAGPRPTASLERPHPRDRRADLPVLEPAVQELVEVLEQVGYTRGTSPDKVALTARAALQRAGLSRREVDALRGMLAKVRRAVET